MNRRNHLTDHEIEQYIETSHGPDIDSHNFESHIEECERCRLRLLQSERRGLGVLETGRRDATRTPECPSEETLEKFLMGACAPDISQQIIQHVTDCSYCAPALKAYLEVVDPVPTLWERLVSYAQSLLHFPIWYRTALAGGSALVLALVWPGPILINLYQLHRAESFAAAFSREKPPNELRTSWSPYPKAIYQTMAGPRPSPADDPNLASANQLAAEKLKSTDPRWIRLRGRVKLLLGEDDDATRLLAAATEKGLNDPATKIDLAVAYFQRDIDNQGADTKSPVNLSESLELLAKVLREPKLDQQEKEIALFDLAVVYEKMQLWDQAVLTWNKYLDSDAAGPWHDEAFRRREKAKEKVSPKPQGYREPAFFLRHFDNPEVQENLEEYQDIALRAWLLTAATHQDSEEALAIRKLAEWLERRHGDSWMHDFLNARSSGDFPASRALSAAITNNKQGQYTAAETFAHAAALAFKQTGNYAGGLRARFEAVYAHQQLLQENACLKEAEALEKETPARYTWLRVQIALEQATCLNFDGKVKASQEKMHQALQDAIASDFHILRLRVHSLEAGIQVSNNCKMTLQEAQAGLELYWRGPASAQRLYEFLSPVKQCFEKKGLWHAAEALEQRMITILEHEIPPDDENVLLEVTAHRALGQILREFGEYAASEIEEQIALLLLPRVDKTIASMYEVPMKLELADLQLEQGDTGSALATIREAKEVIDRTDNPFFHLAFFGIQGDIHLARKQWVEAGEDYKKGVEIAEKRLRQFGKEEKRRQWIEEVGDVYRGLVEVFLQQKRIEEALKLWEWYQGRPFLQEPQSEEGSSAPTWQEIEQTVLAQPLPPRSITRLVYASTRNRLHIWTIGSTGISAVSIAEKREDLRRKIHQYIEKCSMRQDPELRVPAPDLESNELFSWLLQPVMVHLHPSETVVIDLDTGMTRLPLEALKSPEGWYFGEKFPVAYSPGYLRENELRQVSQQKPRWGLRLYALGPGGRDRFSGVFPAIKAVDGVDMNPADLPSLLEPSEIFAFFGHGDESGGLIFRKGSRPLIAKDFLQKSLQHMQLAVLVGCSTGVAANDFLDTSNLVRAFHSAGTPSVIASHWNVNMEATSKLMTSFSTHFTHGESAAHALYEARKETIRTYAHPYYWAGFVLSGHA